MGIHPLGVLLEQVLGVVAAAVATETAESIQENSRFLVLVEAAENSRKFGADPFLTPESQANAIKLHCAMNRMDVKCETMRRPYQLKAPRNEIWIIDLETRGK
jgi:hypothetical protein